MPWFEKLIVLGVLALFANLFAVDWSTIAH